MFRAFNIALCLPFFAKTAKKGKPRRAPAHFFRKNKKREKNASGDGAREKQKQSQKQSQNPGGNPPDPFFLLIIFVGTPQKNGRL
ncbi:MAG: hypothetical protein H7829_18610 [Magnetococcus sp. THC-1_WYH]